MSWTVSLCGKNWANRAMKGFTAAACWGTQENEAMQLTLPTGNNKTQPKKTVTMQIKRHDQIKNALLPVTSVWAVLAPKKNEGKKLD